MRIFTFCIIIIMRRSKWILKKTGTALKALRTAKGMTQKELSEKLSVEAKTVSKWETDSGFPIYEFLAPDEINARCFENTRLRAIPHINFCRAVLNKR